MKKIVIDTNVLVAGFKSKNGASNYLLTLIGLNKFKLYISVALVLEYEAVLLRSGFQFSTAIVNDFLDYVCAVSVHQECHFLWRPTLKDSNDDMVLELAVAGSVDYIISYNKRDFIEAKHFDITVLTPKEFMDLLGE